MLKITIVTVIYNAESTIEQTISSVIRQTYKNKEYVIIDGASTDGSVEIIRKYDRDISYWVSEADQGIYDAMNKGIDVATGDYILFLGADDAFVADDVLENAVSCIERIYSQGKKADIVSFPVMFIDEDMRLEKKVGNTNRDMKYPLMIPHPGMFCRRSLLKKYMFDIKYKIAADYKFFLKCHYDDDVDIEFAEDPAVVYFSVGGGSSVNDSAWKEMRDIQLEMGFPINKVQNNEGRCKKIFYRIKQMLRRLKLLFFVRIFFKGWKKHCCNNEICRWCGRVV